MHLGTQTEIDTVSAMVLHTLGVTESYLYRIGYYLICKNLLKLLVMVQLLQGADVVVPGLGSPGLAPEKANKSYFSFATLQC